MVTFISYEKMKASYEAFKKDLPKDPFTRYSQELIHVRNLMKTAKLKGLDKDVFEYQKIADESVEQLNKMGYNVE